LLSSPLATDPNMRILNAPCFRAIFIIFSRFY
jgi:hypothetical protein